jgi:hypothetical protein
VPYGLASEEVALGHASDCVRWPRAHDRIGTSPVCRRNPSAKDKTVTVWEMESGPVKVLLLDAKDGGTYEALSYTVSRMEGLRLL